MTTLAYVPVIDVYVAFTPTSGATLNTAYAEALPASGMSNSYWTNVSQYLRDLDTHSGREHFLDRIEAGTFSGTFYGNDGFFWNGTVNGTGASVNARMPIAVTYTWSGSTYPGFFGLIDSAKEKVTDELRSDVLVEATDQLKQLSLRRMESPAFWAQFTNSTSVTNYYDCTTTRTAVVTGASGNGTTVTYVAFNDFLVGDTITIVGLGIYSGASLNLVNVVVASASGSGFTVTNSTVGVGIGTGSGYRSRIIDQIGSSNGLYKGVVSFPNAGAIIYVANACVDLANGSNAATGYIQLPAFSSTHGGVDFWVLGQEIPGLILLNVETTISSTPYPLNFYVNSSGYVAVDIPTYSATIVTHATKIDDGYWHHIGLVDDSSGHLEIYVDGTFQSLSAIATCTGWKTATNLVIGNTNANLGAPAMQVDEICISGTSSLSTIQAEVKNRYRAGTLLQLPTNPAGSTVLSGDRIAEILCIAGYGTISGGDVVLNSNLYYINDGSAWVKGTSGNGFVDVQPWYWDTPVYDSTALDLIYEICDTDIGSFFQKDDGTFAYHNQLYFGTWTWTAPSGPGSWTPDSYSPSGDHVWTDDDSGYAYDGPTLDAPRDDADVWTEVQVTPQSGIDQIYEDAAAQAAYGYNTLTKSGTVHNSLSDALSTANFLGYLFRSPLQRVQSVTLLAETDNGSQNTALIDVPLDDVVKFKRTPPNADSAGLIDQNMIVESISRSFDAEAGTFHVTYTLDPYPIRS